MRKGEPLEKIISSLFRTNIWLHISVREIFPIDASKDDILSLFSNMPKIQNKILPISPMTMNNNGDKIENFPYSRIDMLIAPLKLVSMI